MQSRVLLLVVLVVLACCQTRYPQGENLYRAYCANCHMDDGSGLARLIPPLTDTDHLGDLSKISCAVRYGSEDGTVVNSVEYTEPMPSFNNLTPVEISNIVNYIYTSWGNALPPVSPGAVEEALERCNE